MQFKYTCIENLSIHVLKIWLNVKVRLWPDFDGSKSEIINPQPPYIDFLVAYNQYNFKCCMKFIPNHANSFHIYQSFPTKKTIFLIFSALILFDNGQFTNVIHH